MAVGFKWTGSQPISAHMISFPSIFIGFVASRPVQESLYTFFDEESESTVRIEQFRRAEANIKDNDVFLTTFRGAIVVLGPA